MATAVCAPRSPTRNWTRSPLLHCGEQSLSPSHPADQSSELTIYRQSLWPKGSGRALRSQAAATGGRYRLRGSSDAELAGRGEGDRTSYSGERQIETRGWHLLAQRLSL